METIHGNLSPRLDAGLLYISPWKLGLNEDPSHRHSCSIEAPACMPLCHGSQGALVCFVRPAAVDAGGGYQVGVVAGSGGEGPTLQNGLGRTPQMG